MHEDLAKKYRERHRFYHNLDHINYMHDVRKNTIEMFSEEDRERLIDAIDYHDVIYDSLGNNEKRSAEFYKEDLGQDFDPVVYDAILATECHILKNDKPITNALIFLDLYALTDPVLTERNWFLISQESMSMFRCIEKEFAARSIEFMGGLKERMKTNEVFIQNLHGTERSKMTQWHNDVVRGINSTIELSHDVLF